MTSVSSAVALGGRLCHRRAAAAVACFAAAVSVGAVRGRGVSPTRIQVTDHPSLLGPTSAVSRSPRRASGVAALGAGRLSRAGKSFTFGNRAYAHAVSEAIPQYGGIMNVIAASRKAVV